MKNGPQARAALGAASALLGRRRIDWIVHRGRPDALELLSSLSLFADLGGPQLEAISHTFEETTFAPGQRILRQGISGSNFYVVAGSRENVASTASFSLPCIGAGATATLLGEGRALPVSSAGTITDSFADGNAIHVYRIDGGSRCGLA